MRRCRIFSIAILVILLLNNSIVLANTGDEIYLIAKKTADTLGYSEGKIVGSQTSSKDNISTPYDLRPKYKDVIKKYSYYLTNNDKNFETYFITGFYEGFDRGYYDAIFIRTGNILVEPKFTYADAFGLLYGEIHAAHDYHNGYASNWSKAMPTDSTITELFSLGMETTSYRIYFLKLFKEKFKEGYVSGYEVSLQEPKNISLETGTSDGEELGSKLGIVYGAKDYYDKNSNNYNRNIPSDSDILTYYSLKKESPLYREGFLIGFKNSYEESYSKSFREANLNLKILDDVDGFDNGYDTGWIKGEIQATKDYTLKKASNWKTNSITNSNIIIEHYLLLKTDNYRQGFISGYWKGFSESYINTYNLLRQKDSLTKSTIVNISAIGGRGFSGDNGLLVQVDKGIFYNNVVLNIDTLSDNSYKLENKYIKASNYYRIDITNATNDYDNSIPITLEFEYFGKQNGGIYKLVNDKWAYLPSRINEGKISANVEARTLNSKSGTYVVLVDNEVPILYDIRGHWAKEEINTFIRRGIVNGYSDKTFRPDSSISRVEFLSILSRVYEWKITNDTENIKIFKDLEKFQTYENVISYAYHRKYINGYSDGTFRPGDYISYKEVEIIMQRVLGDENFNWYNIASRILTDKIIRCFSYDSNENKITRAELIYMLYSLNQWKY
ncbi:S-layer homology domain-containing protein [Tissierella sp.]|uniref:S-layer homology domain-containing protein n=1 Tax=Tissierella sp. TaxID=41274 RepID=UPI0028661BD1|nr:S-layer homology domain-containing protein [Tissierella sp.]MDR7856128.1 S-layer homology domain-containing protein [Tissierella sp.]